MNSTSSGIKRLHHLAILREELGSLDRVRQVVKLLGMVNAVPDLPFGITVEIELIVEVDPE